MVGTKPSKRQDERGSMLIVALGILTLLSVLALTFVSIMRLEQTASTNYVDGVKARLIAEGGLEMSVAQLKVFAIGEAYSDPKANWIYANGNYHLPIEESSAARVLGEPGYDANSRASFAGMLAVSYNNGLDQYKVKVLDTQTQFNLNTRYEILDDVDYVYTRFLDALGVAISRRTRAGTGGTGRNPILNARYPKGSPSAVRGGEAIYKFRQSREGQRFSSKSELLEVLANEDDYNLLQDYVTTRSWFDPNTVTAVPMDGLDNKPWADVQAKELRSPININLATTEVLAANLAGIAGRFIYLYTGNHDTRDSRLRNIDEGTSFASSQYKEETAYGTIGILCYIAPFGFQRGQTKNDPPIVSGAIDFAQKIRARVMGPGPFKSFAEWEDFVDTTLSDGYLMSFRDPDSNEFCFPAHDRAPADQTYGPMFTLSHDAVTTLGITEDEVRRQPNFATAYYEAVRSMIKSNFNPNARLNGWNPDHVIYLPCDKGSLLFQHDVDPYDTTPPTNVKAVRQTNEWCLASKGIYEITSLGEVLGEPPADVTKGTDRIIYAQAKVQGVVQLYETLTHTTQRDFERAGFTYQADRDMVSSWPVPRLFWDPRGDGLSAAEEQDKLERGEGKYLNPSSLDGHLQLSGRIQVPDPQGQDPGGLYETNTAIVPLGTGRRFELLFQDRRVEAPGSTQPSNDDNLIADVSNGVRNTDAMGIGPCDGQPRNGFGWPYGDAGRGVAPTTRSSTEQLAWKWDVVTPDGYLNSELRETQLWYRASDQDSETMPASPDGRLRGRSMPSGGNVAPALRGGVELWYKPDFDWKMPNNAPDGRYCGLLTTSHVAQNPSAYSAGGSPSLGSWTRGTQMFVTRTTSGDLRIVRLYYEVCGPTNDPQEEPQVMKPDGSGLVSFSAYAQSATSDITYVWPPKELLDIPYPYVNIKFSRTDHWVPFQYIEDWKAHEWHHIAVYWDDDFQRADGEQVWVWLDGKGHTVGNGRMVGRQWPNSPTMGGPVNGRYTPMVPDPSNPTGPPIPAASAVPPQVSTQDGKLPSFVRLNTYTGPYSTNPTPQEQDVLWPKDQVIIGAVRRDQAIGPTPASPGVGSGVFKHAKNALLPANGTIDDVRFWDGNSPQIGANRTPDDFSADAGRYDRGTGVGVWTNEFDLSRAFSNGVDEIKLAAVTFTAYLPRRYGSETPFPAGKGDVTIVVELRRADGTVETRAHWNDAFTSNRGDAAMIPLTDKDPSDPTAVPIALRRGDKLVYMIEFSPAMNGSNVGVASPVLDDVSLVYYLPNAQVLLKERVIN
jgi:hypothetical protein